LGCIESNLKHTVFPEEKKINCIPPKEDVLRVFAAANPDIHFTNSDLQHAKGRINTNHIGEHKNPGAKSFRRPILWLY
jgi:hypothetical protein